MSAGIQVFNQNKTIQISSELTPLFLRRSGQLSTSSSEWLTLTEYQTVCRTKDPIDLSTWKCPLVFFRSATDNYGVTPMLWGDGQLFFYRWWNLPLNTPVQYYIFDMWTPPERTKSGLQLWHQTTKELIFDSSWNPLQIKKIYRTPVDRPGLYRFSDYAYQIDTGLTGNIAVGFSTHRSVSINSRGSSSVWGWLLRECAWIDRGTVYIGNIVTTGDFTSWDGYVPTLNPYEHGSNLYVIDTTLLPGNYGY